MYRGSFPVSIASKIESTKARWYLILKLRVKWKISGSKEIKHKEQFIKKKYIIQEEEHEL